jgi:tRNA threonylcarbamoyladenosine biosynthesis protein TsaB
MKILAVDTALGACSVAVLDGEFVRAHRWIAMARGHAEALAPMVDEAMREADLAFADIDRMAVTTGPGTFTGQRVGLAFMRGLRLALARPLVGVTTLDTMAAAAAAQSGRRSVAVLHEARKGEVYATLVLDGNPILPVQLAEFGAMIAAIARSAGALANGPVALAGTAAEPAFAQLQNQGMAVDLTTIRQPDALWAARLAVRSSEPIDVPKPLYLRAPDAKVPGQSFVAPGHRVQLRTGDHCDSAVLASLHAACFSEAWSASSFHELLAAPGVFVTLAEFAGRPVGFALGRTAADEAELLSIGVNPAARRAGLGRLLVERTARRAAEQGAAGLFLEVAHDNEAARALYERLGFHAVGTRKSYYREREPGGSDALVLRAALPLRISSLGNDPKVD